MPVDVVADHDGVVHNDADRHQKREHREHVERLVGAVHDGPGSEHGERDAHRHPEGDLEIEKQCEHDKHDDQALHSIRDQHVEAVSDVDGLIGPDCQVVARGEFRIDHVLLHGGDHREQVFARTAVDRHHHPGSAIDPIGGGDVGKLVTHLTEVADGEHEAIRERDERQFGDLRPDIPLVLAAEQDLTPLATDGAAGEFEVLTADDIGHLLQREAIFAERCLGDLDVDLVILGTEQVGRRHGGQGKQVVTHDFGHVAEFAFCRRIAGIVLRGQHPHLDRRRSERDLLHLGILGEFRHARNAFNL